MTDNRRNRRLQVLVVLATAFVLSFAASALALDPPHTGVANCQSCHSAAGLYNSEIGTSIDNTPQNMLCHTCHYKTGGNKPKVTHSALTTGSDEKPYIWNSTWAYECRTCHNPHYQKQSRLSQGPWLSDGNMENDGAWIFTGTIDAIVANNIIDADANLIWGTKNLGGYLVQPNANLQIYYKIDASNTTGLATDRDIFTGATGAYAKPGDTYAISYGKLVKRTINRRRVIKNKAGQTFNSPGYDVPNYWATATLFNDTGDHSQAPKGEATNANTTALCVVCHTRTKYNNIGYAIKGQAYDPTINPNYNDPNVGNNPHLEGSASSDKLTCWDTSRTGCHKPPEEGFDEKAQCGLCHGNPMTVAADLVEKIKQAGVVNTSTTGSMADIGAHKKHNDKNQNGSLNCVKCHETGMTEVVDTAPTIGNYKIEIQFGIPGHKVGTYKGRISMTSEGPDDAGDPYTYNSPLGHVSGNDNSRSCSNVWCHDPTPAQSGTINVPTWTQGTGPGNCGACHKALSDDPPTLGKHKIHTGLGNSTMMDELSCTTCHPHSGAIPNAYHVTGYIDIDLTTSYPGDLYNGVSSQSDNSLTAEGSYNNCTIYCHSNANPLTEGSTTYTNPSWNKSAGSMGCSGCHRNATDGTTQWSFPHYAHTNTSTYGFICKDCHYDVVGNNDTIISNALHMNKQKNVAINSTWGASADYSGTICSNVTCHSTGQRADTGLTNYVDADWNTGSTDCGTCHRTNDTSANMLATPIQNMSLVHVKHVATDKYNYGCEKCHKDTVTSSSDIYNYPWHTNGVNNVAMSSGTYSSGTNLCSSVECHGDGDGGSGNQTPDWTDKTTGECGDCHYADATNPPSTSAHTAHVGTAKGYKYECYMCHKDIVSYTADSDTVPTITDMGQHVDFTNDVVFNTTVAGDGASFTSPDCSNIYCHSNAEPTDWGVSNVYSNLSWGGTVSGCDACHNKLNDTDGNWSTVHNTHVGGGSDEYGQRFDCNACHSTVASNGSTIIDNSLHVDGYKQVVINTDFGTSPTWSSPNCSSVDCHSTGRGTHNTVAWDDTLDCTGCHMMADTRANLYAIAVVQNLSPAHIRHIGNGTDEYGNYGLRNVTAIMCDNCHINTTDDNATINSSGMSTYHVDLNKDVAFNIEDFNTTAASESVWNGTGCSNLYCHGNSSARGWTNGATNLNPRWDDTFAACGTECHGQPPDLDPGPGEDHPGSSDCSNCHKHVISTDDGFIAGKQNQHIDGILQAATDCDNCHGQPPMASDELLSGPATGRTVGAHTIHNAAGYGENKCGKCHTGGGSDESHPVNSLIQIGFANTAGSLIPVYTNGIAVSGGFKIINDPSSNTRIVNSTGGSLLCDNIYCHSDGGNVGGTFSAKQVDWGDSQTGDCNICHGTAGGAYVTTDAHSTHVDGGTYNLKCYECHADTVDANNTVIANIQHVDQDKDVAWRNATDSGFNADGNAYVSPNCSNIYCHSKGTSDSVSYGFGNAPYVAASWDYGSMQCDDCHGGANDGTDEMETGAHQSHIANASYVGKDIGCAECHAATASSDSTIGTYANHVNKKVNVQFDDSINLNSDNPFYNGLSSTAAGGAIKVPGPAASSGCQNVYCHSLGNTKGTNPQNFFNTIAWDDPAIDCDDCHGNMAGKSYPVYSMQGLANANAHIKHVEAPNNYTCDYCHVDTTLDGSTINTTSGAHLNRQEDVVFKANGGATGTYNDAPKTCSSTYCHSGTDPAWNDTLSGCGGCHDANKNLAQRHDVHYNTTTQASGIVTTNSTTETEFIFGCGNCHPNAGEHATGPAQGYQSAELDGAQVAGANYTPGASNHVDSKGYNYTVNGQCDNLYCHSDARGTYASPTWNTTVTGACNICHDEAGATSTNLSGAHGAHTNTSGMNYACDQCHSGTVTGSTAINSAILHVNHANDIDSALNFGSNVCSGTDCHGTSTDTWTTSLSSYDTCTKCHGKKMASPADYQKAPGADGTGVDTGGDTAPTDYQVGAHQAHLRNESAYSEPITCGNCHLEPATVDATGHIDNSLPADITWGSLATEYGNRTDLDYNTGTRVCSNTYCHGASIGDNSGNDTTPVWNDVSYLSGTPSLSGDCAQCHGAPPTPATTHKDKTTFAHCNSCHSHIDSADGHITNTQLHIDGYVQQSGCDACHGYPMKDNGDLLSGVYNSGRSGSFSPAIGQHSIHEGYGFDCNDCHSSGGDGADPNHSLRVVNAITMGFSHGQSQGIYNAAAFNYGNYTVNTSFGGTTVNPDTGAVRLCDNIYCHSDGGAEGGGYTYRSADWDATPSGDCNICHGTVGGAYVTTNAHPVHVDGGTYNFKCYECHKDTVDVNNAVIANSLHVDGIKNIAWRTSGMNDDGSAYGDPTCSNIYCHSKGTTNEASYGVGNAPYVPASWDGGSMQCDDCHGGANDGTDEMETGAHQSHIANASYVGKDIGCAECHAATASSDSTIGTYANHVNKKVNVQFDDSINLNSDNPFYNGLSSTAAGGAIKVPGPAASSGCQNVYCHSLGNTKGTNPQNFFNTIAWDDPAINCDDCHGNTAGKSHPVYSMQGLANANAHIKHVEAPNNYTCDYCHVDTTLDGSTINTTSGAHLNRQEDVVFKANGGATGTYNDAPKTCSSTYCHGSTDPAWNDTLSGCGGCHEGNKNLAQRHDVHYNTTTQTSGFAATNSSTETEFIFGCGNCHPTSSHTNGPVQAGFQDAQIEGAQVKTSSNEYAPDSIDNHVDSKGYNYSVDGQCDNIYCHSDARGTYASPIWNATVTSACNICHDQAGATSTNLSGAHGAHTNTSGRNYACDQCHSGTVTGSTAINSAILHVNHANDIDSALNFGSNVCASTNCHGTSSDTWDTDLSTIDLCTKCHGKQMASPADYQKAPGADGTGVDTGGDSAPTDPQVGAHQAHLTTPSNYSVDISCSECHTVPSSFSDSGHANGSADVPLAGALATANKADASKTNYDGTKCSNVYCHDTIWTQGGAGVPSPYTSNKPAWTDTAYLDGTGSDCAKCHGWPPETSHSTGTNCSSCHGHVDEDDIGFTGATNIATHLNGIVNAAGGCDGCHGYPPIQGDGKNSFDNKQYNGGKGAHWYLAINGAHIDNGFLNSVTDTYSDANTQCQRCHEMSYGETGWHQNNIVNVILDDSMNMNYAPGSPSYDGVPTETDNSTAKTCSNINCHIGKTPRWANPGDE